jgi:hypothetical protein
MSLATVVLVQRFVRRLKVRSALHRLVLKICAPRGVGTDVAGKIGCMLYGNHYEMSRRLKLLDLDAPLRGSVEQKFNPNRLPEE